MATSPSLSWHERAVELEMSYGGPVEAGVLAHRFEKFFTKQPDAEKRHLASLNFYCFVHYSRRKSRLSVRDLAQKSGVEYSELISLERDTQYKLKRDSVVKLAKFFGVDENALVNMARLDEPQFDPTWEDDPIQFPDHVATTVELGEFERIAVLALEEILAQMASIDCAD